MQILYTMIHMTVFDGTQITQGIQVPDFYRFTAELQSLAEISEVSCRADGSSSVLLHLAAVRQNRRRRHGDSYENITWPLKSQSAVAGKREKRIYAAILEFWFSFTCFLNPHPDIGEEGPICSSSSRSI